MNSVDQASFLFTLGAGIAGGLILNVMPCVLPGIFFKIQKMIQQVHDDHGKSHRRISGLAFLLGVLISFTVLGIFVVILKSSGKSLGWGMQMQDATFVGALMICTLLFALNSLELFVIPMSFKTKKGSHLLDSVLEGIFISLISIPCSAPILGTAITLALAQDTIWWQTMLLFWSIGLGLASPILLVSFSNLFAKLVPKPGAWSEHFKHIVGVSLLAATVWLYTQFRQLVPPFYGNVSLYCMSIGSGILYIRHLRTRFEPLVWSKAIGLGLAPSILVTGYIYYADTVVPDKAHRALYAVCLLLALWIARLFWQYSQPTRQKVSYVILATIALYSIYWASQDLKHYIEWEPYNKEALTQHLKQDKTVFLDFTANWCQSCKFFEAFYLNTSHTADLFKQHNVVAMQVDLSKNDDHLWDLLKEFNRTGIPVYILYHPNGQVDLLPEGPPLSLSERMIAYAHNKDKKGAKEITQTNPIIPKPEQTKNKQK